ncbi:membrane protein insertase YidC [bacterium]|nr:membrane protein insertase YidC [bacterium]
MENQKNVILAVVISALIFIFWNSMFGPKPVPVTQQTQTTKKQENTDSNKAKTSVDENKKELAKVVIDEKEVENVSEEIFTIENKKFIAEFSNFGASLKNLSLKGNKYRDKAGKQLNLIKESEKNLYSYALSLKDKDTIFLKNTTPYQLVKKTENEIVFSYNHLNLQINKTYSITNDNGYLIKLKVEILNLNEQPLSFAYDLSLVVHDHADTKRDDPMGDAVKNPIYRVLGEDIERISDKDDWKKAIQKKNMKIVGIDERYFTSIIKWNKPDTYTINSNKTENNFGITLSSEPFQIDSKGSISFEYDIYNGPKILELLKEVEAEGVIDYGFVAVVSKMILWLLLFLYGFVGNYGVALILLTLLVKMALYPLTKSSYVSMHKMKQLQPELTKLKEKYGSDKEKMGRETMALYNKNGVNPLGGCLPMLLQMPIWFGLYRAIQNSVELYNEPFMFWIQDLSNKDPFYILPVSLGLLMFIQQKLSTPMGGDQMQAKVMLYTLPIVFGFFMLMLPSGLVLYIWVNTLITIFQQKYINAKLDGVPYFKYLLSSVKK